MALFHNLFQMPSHLCPHNVTSLVIKFVLSSTNCGQDYLFDTSKLNSAHFLLDTIYRCSTTNAHHKLQHRQTFISRFMETYWMEETLIIVFWNSASLQHSLLTFLGLGRPTGCLTLNLTAHSPKMGGLCSRAGWVVMQVSSLAWRRMWHRRSVLVQLVAPHLFPLPVTWQSVGTSMSFTMTKETAQSTAFLDTWNFNVSGGVFRQGWIHQVF